MKPSSSTVCLIACLNLCSACGGGGDQSDGDSPGGLGPGDLKLSGIGDSIMQGFDAAPCALGICFDEPQYSFAQGTAAEVNSLFQRFGATEREFVSVTGAEMVVGSDNAKAQADRICQQKTRPNRVVMLLGANDICASGSVAEIPTSAEFGAALNDALSVLASPACALEKGTNVHVLSVPRVDELYAAGLAKAGVNCNKIWSLFDICSLATVSPTEETLQGIATMVTAYNQVILATVTNLQSSLDPSRELSFSTDYVDATPNTSFGTYEFLPSDLSDIDCFHPSVQGQRKLACLAWESWQGTGLTADCLN
jgi:hypothetical protein